MAAPRIVIDCSRPEPPDPEFVARIEEEALGLLRDGKTDEAQNVMEQVAAMRESIALGATITEVELTDEEIAQREKDLEAAAEAARARLRNERDALLAASDWTHGGDSPLDEKARRAWARYRQELRDYPATVKDPLDPPPWPKPPSPKGAA